MKIVTYNVNGLKQRISQFASLRKLLDSFDADIICFQETKLRRQELTADVAMADGYESFFSCTRTCQKGRMGYSGVATFCRVKSAFSSCEAALPIAAEEGFTGLVNNSRAGKDDGSCVVPGLEDFQKDELLKVDNEGRCVITDHGHFVVFNLYGPRAEADDAERIEFKLKFFKILERRWEYLLHQGRRIFVVGDLNIAPAAIDRCDAGPDFENNEFRKWFRSILLESGGPFVDVFRAKHPDRRDAYTCWPSNTGAEQFNYGTRIDHILFTGSCLHEDHDSQGHSFAACHVKECDILTRYKRFKAGNAPRWKGGLSMKLEGSDHVPVCTTLEDIPDVPQHNTPSLASRYLPVIYGVQQTLVSVLMKRQATKQADVFAMACSSAEENIDITTCGDGVERPSHGLNQESANVLPDEEIRNSSDKAACKFSHSLGSENTCRGTGSQKKAKKGQSFQLSLKSFFTQSSTIGRSVIKSCEATALDDQFSNSEESVLESSPLTQEEDKKDGDASEKQKNDVALQEWQRIRGIMQNSIPLCKGHKEPCVARVVKKPGPTFGRRFYVCARAEGPSSNPEANCGFFRWAASKFREN